MRAKRGAFSEMVDARNRRITASLKSHDLLGRLAVMAARANIYNSVRKRRAEARAIARGEDPAKALWEPHPLSVFIDEYLLMSGAVGGEHRKDLRDAVRWDSMAPTGLMPRMDDTERGPVADVAAPMPERPERGLVARRRVF